MDLGDQTEGGTESAIAFIQAEEHSILKGGRVCAIGFLAQRFGGELPFAIVAKDEIKQRPVAALRQDDVEIAVAVYVAKANARGSFALGFQKQYTLKRACFPGEGRLRRFGVDE